MSNLISFAPWVFLLAGGYKLFADLVALKRAPVIANAESKVESNFAMQLTIIVSAVGTVMWGGRVSPYDETLNLLAATSVWVAAICGIILVIDDLGWGPRRAAMALKNPLAGQPPLIIEVLRRLEIAFVVGALIAAIRAHSFDFSLVLVIAMTVTGLVWLFEALFLRGRRIEAARLLGVPSEAPLHQPVTVEYAISFFPVIVVVLVIRSFLLEPFRIPSGSMMPTLLKGDFIFVSKFSYGLRLPVANTKIVELGTPKRGDVIVFRLPSDPSINYIKRLVGLPGDHVVVRNNRVTINGEAMPMQMEGEYDPNEQLGTEIGMEHLGDVRHNVLVIPREFPRDFDATVPEGHYFFMGDNRNNSQDSRFAAVGFVPEQNLVGRAVRIWLNWPKLKRIGQAID